MKSFPFVAAALIAAVVSACALAESTAAHAMGGDLSLRVLRTTHTSTSAWGAAIDEATNVIWLADPDTDSVTRIDATSNTEMGKPIRVGRNPHHLVVNPATHTVYVANSVDSSVSVIDGTTGSVSTVDLRGAATDLSRIDDIAIDAATGRVFVAGDWEYRPIDGDAPVPEIFGVAEIDPQSNAVHQAVVRAPGHIGSLAIDSARRTLWYDDVRSNDVTQIDVDSFGPIIQLPTGAWPNAIAINPRTGNVYVANEVDKSITVISGTHNTVTATVAVGGKPRALAANPVNNVVFVANDNDASDTYLEGEVTVVDGASNTIESTPTATDFGGMGIVTDTKTDRVFTASYTGQSVQELQELVCPLITSGAFPDTVAGATYRFQVTTFGYPESSITVSAGRLPPGLLLTPTSGAVRGVATTKGVYHFTLTASNGAAPDAKADYTVTVR